MYNDKKISDVLEYLYQNKQKALAEVVLRELRQQREIIRETVIPPVTPPPPNPYSNPLPDDLEVIGNIYQNPELLEKTND